MPTKKKTDDEAPEETTEEASEEEAPAEVTDLREITDLGDHPKAKLPVEVETAEDPYVGDLSKNPKAHPVLGDGEWVYREES